MSTTLSDVQVDGRGLVEDLNHEPGGYAIGLTHKEGASGESQA